VSRRAQPIHYFLLSPSSSARLASVLFALFPCVIRAPVSGRTSSGAPRLFHARLYGFLRKPDGEVPQFGNLLNDLQRHHGMDFPHRVTQLTTQVFPFFEIPNSAVRFVVIALAVGFPIAMLLAWVYEFTASMSLTFSGRLTVLVVAIRQRSNARPFHQTKPCARYNFFRRDAE